MVEFLDGYRDTAAVLDEVRKADIILLPYRSRDQVVSGVLVEAIGSGQARRRDGVPARGRAALGRRRASSSPHEDPAAIAAALRTLLTDPGAAAPPRPLARRQAASLTWETVGLELPAAHARPALRAAQRASL